MTMANFLTIDLPALMLGMLACLACAIPGNFLILRRQALLGDAISHVVLPGIVIGFLLAGSLYPPAIFLGALTAALVAVGLIALVRIAGRMESGAAMGVVFTTMFAIGVVLLEQSHTRRVHLDVQHTLYGSLEGTLWLGPGTLGDLLEPSVWASLPQPIVTLAVVTAALIVLTTVFFKELKLASFDPGLAASLGFRPRIIDVGLMTATACAAIAAFQAVGSILVIAMFICPAASARMLTDRLGVQIMMSGLLAVLSAVVGYGLAAAAPVLFGLSEAISVSGMIATVAGLIQTLAMVFAPRHGALARYLKRRHSLRADTDGAGSFSPSH